MYNQDNVINISICLCLKSLCLTFWSIIYNTKCLGQRCLCSCALGEGETQETHISDWVTISHVGVTLIGDHVEN